jgi:hypothetical protein
MRAADGCSPAARLVTADRCQQHKVPDNTLSKFYAAAASYDGSATSGGGNFVSHLRVVHEKIKNPYGASSSLSPKWGYRRSEKV